jgi:hypothetical protein
MDGINRVSSQPPYIPPSNSSEPKQEPAEVPHNNSETVSKIEEGDIIDITG